MDTVVEMMHTHNFLHFLTSVFILTAMNKLTASQGNSLVVVKQIKHPLMVTYQHDHTVRTHGAPLHTQPEACGPNLLVFKWTLC